MRRTRLTKKNISVPLLGHESSLKKYFRNGYVFDYEFL